MPQIRVKNGHASRTHRLNDTINEATNQRNLLNSTKTTGGDCGPSMASQGVAEVKPSEPSTSFSMKRGGIINASHLKQVQAQDSVSSDLARFDERYSSLQVESKCLRQIAQHWLRKSHATSEMRKPMCEKFELETVDSTINSSLFDDPPYERDEISYSDPPSCYGESAAEKQIGKPPDIQRNNSTNYDFGKYQQSGDSSTKPLCTGGYVETDSWDGIGKICLGFCGLCSRRTKHHLRSSKRQPNLKSGDEKSEVFDAPTNRNIESTISNNFNCVTLGTGEVKMLSQTQPGPDFEINQEATLTKVEDEKEKSCCLPSKLPGLQLDDSYSSGPESEQLCKRLGCLGTKQGMSLLSIHEDDDDWSTVSIKPPQNQALKMKNRNQTARSPQSLPNDHVSRPQTLELHEQFNCCNTHADPLVSDRQTSLLQNEILTFNSQSLGLVHPCYLNSTVSTPSNVCKDEASEQSQTYVCPKPNVSLPELSGHRTRSNTCHKISSLSSFFDTFPCAETMWPNSGSRNSKPYVFEKTCNESEALSQRTYVIAKIDLTESCGPQTYSIPSNSHCEVDDTVKNECLNQHNNNATNEVSPGTDFALPGMVKKPPSFLSLIKEARAANMVPPSLSTPSYSWEKKEAPENDYMTLPSRQPKRQKQVDELGKEITPKNEMEGVVETNPAMPSPQVNQNSTNETKAPSLQSVIENMQKLKATEMQMKVKKEKERSKKIGTESEKALTASQAMENTKGSLVVDYKERRRLRQQKELEEARKEVIEATRSALKDRIAFSKKEGNSTASLGVSKTLFCGSTKAMFSPNASLSNIEKVPEEVEEKEVPISEAVVEESKTELAHCPIPVADVSQDGVEKDGASKCEPFKREIGSKPRRGKKMRKKTKRVNDEKNINPLSPSNMQLVPVENTLVKSFPIFPSNRSQTFTTFITPGNS
ncbi:unnamed protein product [Hydatigera taeniaeformis]|uniref:SH2 domain-containing protein n=1 Tax=Hydatigena taeniaeformis TaxID=6205 RepID=A0A0R3WHK0_HYDTA|nr:unnamed protein product [Hydatigera taeniaeformis]